MPPSGGRRGDGGGARRGRGHSRGYNRNGRGVRGGLTRRDDRSSPAYEDSPDQQQYLGWKMLVRRGLGAMDSLNRGFSLWSDALSILNDCTREYQQSIARDLVSDELNGIEAICITVNACTRNPNDTSVLRTVKPFLQVITHSALLDCISVDSFMGTIYRVMGGTNGDNAIELSKSICRRLISRGEISGAAVDPVIPNMASLIMETMYEFLTRERRARFNEALPSLFESMDDLINTVAGSCSGEESNGLINQLDILRKIVENATNRLVSERPSDDLISSLAPVRSSFPMKMLLPGGRHDNDLANISHIEIIPTYQEVTATEPEYLPSTDLLQPHCLGDPVQRHIDSSFRLLRHDIFEPVKDVLRELLSQDASSNSRYVLNSGDTRAHTYAQAVIPHIFICEKGGLEAILSFLPPPQLRNKSKSEQSRWWGESSRLEEGSLVCFIATHASEKIFLFLEVTLKCTEKKRQASRNWSSLVSENPLPSITVKVATRFRDGLNLLTRIHGERIQGVLVDFPSLIPATFVPILQNLQQMMGQGRVAFQQWILPNKDGSSADITKVPPPKYARSPGFTFSLGSITKEGNSLTLQPSESRGLATSIKLLEHYTTLDHGQCQALLAALTQEYALIQGPPGTGKSYLGVQLVRVLLANKVNANLGPILIICYTNHALDQFLKHLQEAGISKIIRIGGRSVAPELEGMNLRTVSRDIAKTYVERQILGRSYGETEKCTRTAGHLLRPLHQWRRGPSWDTLDPYLSQKTPLIHAQLDPVDEEGYTYVGEDPFTVWLGKRPSDMMANKEPHQGFDQQALTRRAEQNINALNAKERWSLVDMWLADMRESQTERLFESLRATESLREGINGVHDDVDRRALAKADVIGITTTALARSNAMLRRLRLKVVMCEEAAEAKEPDVMAALMTSVEHFIQIGDHRQLRPQINNYSLSMESKSGLKWQLDRSQFERRAVGEPGLEPFPVAQLNVQRRMRPEISRLIRGIYPGLRDHETVEALPDVVGMRRNLFWLDHDHAEDTENDGSRMQSHSNQWEVEMASALVRHLVRQGKYSSTDIALLTPYTGQLRKLRKALSKDFEIFLSDRDQDTLAADGIVEEEDDEADDTLRKWAQPHPKLLQKRSLAQTLRLATVDNFQGEEAKVIVVSLVRSNRNRKVGFLRTENRINVLLSRAQHGMYLIGNSETYLNVAMWADVHGQLSYGDATGKSLPLCCPRHPSTEILCSEPEDFALRSPEGGCDLQCDRRLEPCGHQCQAKCHSDMMHDGFICTRPCPRVRDTCEHSCPKLCGDSCGNCIVTLDDVELPCGHVRDHVPCYQTLDRSTIQCGELVQKIVPDCGHLITIECHTDPDAGSFRCPIPCSSILECGHICPGSCGSCRKQDLDGPVTFEHKTCRKVCDRPYGTCNHRCLKSCHLGEVCGNCRKKCEVRCPHSGCDSFCSQACTPCIEKCAWACDHQGACTMPCAAPCNRLPCNERCTKNLKCGHRCPSYCGEICPEGFCHQCGDKADARVDMLEFKSYSEIDINESPIVVLGCGHFFTGETLDGLVGMAEVYTTDAKGEYTGLQDLSSLPKANTVPSCPDCKRPIRQFATRRHNRVINRAVMDETSKRFIAKGRNDLEALEKNLKSIEESLDSTRYALTRPSIMTKTESVPLGRYVAARDLDREAKALRANMDIAHQPSKKLLDAITTSMRSSFAADPGLLSERMSQLNIGQNSSAFDMRVTLGAWLVSIKVQEVALRDKFAIVKNYDLSSVPWSAPHKHAESFLGDCRTLIAQAREASLLRIAVAAILAFAKVSQLDAWYRRTCPGLGAPGGANSVDQADTARGLLKEASDMCGQLQESQTSALRKAVEATMQLYEGPRYEQVTPEELAAIKTAMVSGAGGIATHSGHWYNCAKGHPFAIGECGMPMELATCPECGSPIGGQSHQLVEGSTRATNMEG